jgi:hypothetical protein
MKPLAIKAVKLDFPVPPRPTVTKVFKTNNLKLFAVFLIKNSHILSMVLIGFFLLFYILRNQFLMKKRLINKQTQSQSTEKQKDKSYSCLNSNSF